MYIRCKIRRFLNIIVIVIFVISCKKSNKNNFILNNDEILIYYDKQSDDFKSVKGNYHEFISDYSVSKYNLSEMKLLEDLTVVTKDEKTIELNISYWYQLNESSIIEIHKRYGVEFLNELILPQLRETIRTEYKKINFKNHNKKKIEVSLMIRLKNKNIYSKMIISKNIIIN